MQRVQGAVVERLPDLGFGPQDDPIVDGRCFEISGCPTGRVFIPNGHLSRTLADATRDLDIHSSGGFLPRVGNVVAAGESDGDGAPYLASGTLAADRNRGEVTAFSSMVLQSRRGGGPHAPSTWRSWRYRPSREPVPSAFPVAPESR